MQKKLIALALASLAGSAFAQSQVTVYGVADLTYDYVGATGGDNTIKKDARVNANSSYLGFKGAEDLGNGLKAVFQFETSITNDAGNSAGYNNNPTGANGAASNNIFGGIRDTFVGISGGFGTVVGGNLTAAARALGAKVDVNSGATGVGYQAATFGRIGATRTGIDDRTANAIAYVSPNFSGFSGLLAWGAGSENRQNTGDTTTTVATPSATLASQGFTGQFTCAGTTVGTSVAVKGDTVTCAGAARTDNVYSLGLNYENGPFYVGYAYTQADGVSAAGNSTKAQSNRVGGYFKFGTAQIGALWDRTDADTNTANNKRNAWALNGKFGIGAGNIIAGYDRAHSVDGTTNTGAQHYFVGYEHSLSKRTILKAVYAQVQNQSGANYNFYNDYTGQVEGTGNGNDPRALSLGIRHSF